MAIQLSAGSPDPEERLRSRTRLFRPRTSDAKVIGVTAHGGAKERRPISHIGVHAALEVHICAGWKIRGKTKLRRLSLGAD